MNISTKLLKEMMRGKHQAGCLGYAGLLVLLCPLKQLLSQRQGNTSFSMILLSSFRDQRSCPSKLLAWPLVHIQRPTRDFLLAIPPACYLSDMCATFITLYLEGVLLTHHHRARTPPIFTEAARTMTLKLFKKIMVLINK